jgi:hypothetical protein
MSKKSKAKGRKRGRKEEFVCPAAFMQRRASFAECIPLRISILKDKSSFSPMTFFSLSLSLPPALATSAIFLPSKAANPFSSFHWCLKLPWPRPLFFSPFPKRGHGRAVFFAAHHPSMPCGSGTRRASSSLVASPVNARPPLHSTPPGAFLPEPKARVQDRHGDEALDGQSIIKLASFTGVVWWPCMSWTLFFTPLHCMLSIHNPALHCMHRH